MPEMNQSTTRNIDRSRPPKSGKASRVPFPHYTIHRLRNGVQVYIVRNHSQPYVSMQLVFRSGAAYDGPLPGLANFTANLLLSGAGNRNAEELADEIDFYGASLDAGAGRDSLLVRVGVLTRYLPALLDLTADVVLQPSFPEEEIERERRQALASLKQNRSDPAYLAATRFRSEIFGDAPYGSAIEGTDASLKQINRNECRRFHEEHFRPQNAFIVVAGDVQPKECVAMLNERFGEWSGPGPADLAFNEPAVPASPRVIVVDRPGSVQSALKIGRLGIRRNDPDYLPFVTVNTLFGGYFNSRINRNLREEHGYTYGARSTVNARKLSGSFSISASVGTNVTAPAVAEIMKELRGIVDEPVESEELQMVKNYVTGAQALQTETPDQVAGMIRTMVLHDLPADYFEQFPDMVNRLRREQLRSVAGRRMAPDTMSIVVAGAADAIAADLEAFGPVTVVGHS